MLWLPVSAGILALVLQLYERNKLKLNIVAAAYQPIAVSTMPLIFCSERR